MRRLVYILIITFALLNIYPTAVQAAYTTERPSFFARVTHNILCIFSIGDCDTAQTESTQQVAALPLAVVQPDTQSTFSVVQDTEDTTDEQQPTIIQNISNPVVERVFNTREVVIEPDFTREEFDTKLSIQINQLRKELAKASALPSTYGPASKYGVRNTWGLTQRVDNLSSVDFSNGTVSGSTITSSPISGSSGSFTTLEASGVTTLSDTLGVTGAVTLSDLTSGGVVQAASGTGLLSASTIGGSSITADSLDFSEFKDAMTLDATTTIDMDTNSADLNLDSGTFVVDSSANRVGVGTASPSYKLDVNGTGRFTGDTQFDSSVAIGPSFTPTGATSASFTISSSVDDISGLGFTNTSTGTSADSRFTVEDTTGNYTAFSLPGVNNTVASLFGLTRGTTSFIFNNGGTVRDLAIGTLGAKSLVFGTSNAERMRIDSSGNVGIGTTTPSYKLDVSGTLNATGATTLGSTLAVTGNTTVGGTLGVTGNQTNSGTLAVTGATTLSSTLDVTGDATFDTNTLFVDATNNRVGVGTTTPSTNLDIVNNTSGYDGTLYRQLRLTNADTSASVLNAGTITTIGSYIGFESGYASSYNYKATKATAGGIKYEGGRIDLYNDSGLTVGATYNPTERLSITSSGNVGIGTTAPSEKLHVAGGDIVIDAEGSGNTASLKFINDNERSRISSNYDTGGGGRLTFYTDTTGGSLLERMRIDNAGNVGIGTTAPSYKLDVNGDINFAAGSALKIAGTDVLTASTTNSSVTLGQGAGANLGSTALYNTAIGRNALNTATSSDNNTAVGYYTLQSNTSGSFNTAQGSYALLSNTTGSSNTAQGAYSLQNNTTGYSNSAQGYKALLSNTTGYNNTAQGYYALRLNTTGRGNVAQGMDALQSNTTGSYNTAIGNEALSNNTTSFYNTAQGYQAGRYIADGTTANATSSNSLYLGANTKALASGDTNEIVIGYNATGIGSNSVVLGNDSITTTALKGNVGIGTTNPLSLLQISGDDPELSINDSDGTVRNARIRLGTLGGNWYLTSGFDSGTDSNFYISRSTDNSDVKLSIDRTSGNVGIGTTTPTAQLHTVGNLSSALTGTVSVTAASTTVTGTGTAFTTELAVGDSIKIGSETFTVSAIASDTSLTLDSAHSAGATGATAYSDPNLFALDNGDSVSKLVVDKSGNVGVGTASPTQALDVVGNINISGLILADNTTDGHQIGKLNIDYNSSSNPQLSSDGTLIQFIDDIQLQNNSRLISGPQSTSGLTIATTRIATPLIFSTSPVSTGTYVEAMRIDGSTGNVGIGTTTPSSKLHVIGDVQATTFNSQNLSNGGQGNSLVVGTGATVAGARSTAIGYGASANSTSGGGVAVGNGSTASYASVAIGNGATTSGSAGVAIGNAANTSGASVSIGSGAVGNVYGAAVGSNAKAGAYAVAVGYGADAYTNVSTAGVALGRGALLTGNKQFVVGANGSSLAIPNIYFGSGVIDTTPQSATIYGTSGSGTDVAGADISLAGGRGTGAGAGGSIRFKTAPAGTTGTTLNTLYDRMVIDQSGNVGIGTTTPADVLDVQGDIRVGTGTAGCVKDADGTVIAGTCSSDERLKTNIEDITDVLAKFNDLRIVNYKWNDLASETYTYGTEANQIGALAQNVEGLFPELVVEDDKGYKQVNYTGLQLYAFEAIKELSAKVQELFDWKSKKDIKIAELEQRIAALERSANVANAISSNQDETPASQSVSDKEFTLEITVLGNNPAQVELGATYSDLGATATNPDGGDLSITTLVDGVEVENIELDTTVDTTYAIEYRVTYEGQEAVATREVIVGEGSQENGVDIEVQKEVDTEENEQLPEEDVQEEAIDDDNIEAQLESSDPGKGQSQPTEGEEASLI